jgi:hypothetical protein
MCLIINIWCQYLDITYSNFYKKWIWLKSRQHLQKQKLSEEGKLSGCYKLAYHIVDEGDQDIRIWGTRRTYKKFPKRFSTCSKHSDYYFLHSFRCEWHTPIYFIAELLIILILFYIWISSVFNLEFQCTDLCTP